MEKYNIVFATDENYTQHLCVALISLLNNNKDIFIDIYLISSGLTISNSKKINSITSRFNCSLFHIAITDDHFSKLITNHHFTKAMYYRLLIPKFLEFDKVLYLDCDIVVNGSIKYFYNIDIDSYFAGAVINPQFDRHNDLKMNPNSNYFNSGVILINLKKWRDGNLGNKVTAFIDKNKAIIEFPDQDGLNAIINGNWKKLPLKYNQQAIIFESNFIDNYDCFSTTELEEGKISPVIIHYTGSSKPWHLRNKHPYKYLYWRYLRMTPFRFSLPSDLTVLNILKFVLPKSIKTNLKLILK